MSFERSVSPYINQFLSADTVVPGYANPQNLNRYSYVTNNPLRYTDPTGHMADYGGNEGGGGCNSIGCFPQPPSNPPGGGGGNGAGGNTPPNSTPSPSSAPSGTPTPIPTLSYSPYGPCIGTPISPGNFYGGYCGSGGGISPNGFSSVGGDGECIGSICVFSGASVPLRYGASYDVLLYDNLLIVNLHEHYWMPGYAPPLMENPSFGHSTLVSVLSSGQQATTNLGHFTPGSLAHPEVYVRRDTSINYYGKENFPASLSIQIFYGAQNLGAQTINYPLPFVP